MSLTEEPTAEISGYPIIAWANGQDLVLFQQFGSYQGEWLMLSHDAEQYFFYKGWYGSCTGCDDFHAEFDSGSITLRAAKKFAKKYKTFIEVPKATMRNLILKGTLKSIMPANIKDYNDNLDIDSGERVDSALDSFTSDAVIAVKLIEDIEVTSADIVACKNQEIKQNALKRFGYERFVAEVDFKTIHVSGENSLLRKDDVVFVYVKDSSTSRRYLLRVPPNMQTVEQAIAWTFGMQVGEYKPLVET